MKIYCKNCKFWDGGIGDYGDGDECIIYKTNIFSDYIKDYQGFRAWHFNKNKVKEVLNIVLTEENYWEVCAKISKSILNKNFNCKYYKRKWWKFWL